VVCVCVCVCVCAVHWRRRRVADGQLRRRHSAVRTQDSRESDAAEFSNSCIVVVVMMLTFILIIISIPSHPSVL